MLMDSIERDCDRSSQSAPWLCVQGTAAHSAVQAVVYSLFAFCHCLSQALQILHLSANSALFLPLLCFWVVKRGFVGVDMSDSVSNLPFWVGACLL